MFQLYNNRIYPFLMNRSLKKDAVEKYRIDTLKEALGNILEIGYGTGSNAHCYPAPITEITAIDTVIMKHVATGIKVTLHKMSVTDMAFPDESFDTVVSTFTLCSIADLKEALAEIKRVLKPGGILLFLEHGKNNNRFTAFLQQVLNPFYNILACGCNVNRDFETILAVNGFTVTKCAKSKIKGKPITGYVYSGLAKKQE